MTIELIEDEPLPLWDDYDEPQGNCCSECGDDCGALFGSLGLCPKCREEAVKLAA